MATSQLAISSRNVASPRYVGGNLDHKLKGFDCPKYIKNSSCVNNRATYGCSGRSVKVIARSAPRQTPVARSKKISTQDTVSKAWEWASELPSQAKGLILSVASSLSLAEVVFANEVDLDNVNLFEVQCGVAFALGMIATGYYLVGAEGEHHGEAEGSAAKEVCRFDDSVKDGYVIEMQDPEVDLYRDTLVRYLGYSNEVGEAFRPLVGDFSANLTYVVAVSYVMADAIDKGKRASSSSTLIKANEMFKELDTTAQGSLSYDEVKAAFKKLDVSLAEDKVDAYLKKANVLKGGRISYKEFMWAVDRMDKELEMLLEAGSASESGPWGSQTSGKTGALVAVSGVDCLIWQLTASVIMPGFTINRIVTLTAILLSQYAPTEGVISQIAPFIPTVVGLGVIPFIVTPLDELAEVLMNITLRKFVFTPLTATDADSLSQEELVSKLDARSEQLPQPKLVELFKQIDEDDDGKVSVKDWSTKGSDMYNEYLEKYGSASKA